MAQNLYWMVSFNNTFLRVFGVFSIWWVWVNLDNRNTLGCKRLLNLGLLYSKSSQPEKIKNFKECEKCSTDFPISYLCLFIFVLLQIRIT